MNAPEEAESVTLTPVRHGSREYLQLLRNLKARRQGLILVLAATQVERRKLATTVADNLGRRLHRVDLAEVTEKYIGETEKNLSRVLERAAQSDVVLLLDEGDALMARRAEVKDSHDRYANIEINYLVQRVESHSGLCVLGARTGAALPDRLKHLLVGVVHDDDTDVPDGE